MTSQLAMRTAIAKAPPANPIMSGEANQTPSTSRPKPSNAQSFVDSNGADTTSTPYI